MSHAYYNEIDPYAAAWLRELIREGLIADGTVDERDIRDVAPDELAGFAQCHFFAGIGVWSYALRSAGWPDDRQVWTGSCPCQPFSAAGKRGGTDDERHLWPSWFHLIEQRRPAVVFGEQVASADGLGWLDLVQADLEGAHYATGAVDLCAAGIGAPHIRQRLWFVAERLADADDARLEGRRQPERQRSAQLAAGPGSLAGGLADSDGRDASAERQQRGGEQRQQPQDGSAGGLADTGCERLRSGQPGSLARAQEADTGAAGQRERLWPDVEHGGARSAPGPVNGLWRDADWLFCRDGKWRPVEPRTFPLANAGAYRNRVAELRGAGNAIVAPAAQAFIEAYLAS